MPIKYKIFPDKKIVYALGTGEITFNDLLLHIEELAKDPNYKAPMKKIVGYRNSTLSKLTTEEANKFTNKKSQLKDIFQNEMCAFVTHADLDFGLSRVHGAHIESSNITTNVFRSIEDAFIWLGVELEEKEIKIG